MNSGLRNRLATLSGIALLACTFIACGGGAPTSAVTPAAVQPTVPSTSPATLAISTSALPIGNVQKSYATTLAATGNSGPVKWDVVSGALPPGVQLASESGVISGTPVAQGIFNIGLQVADSVSSVTRSFQIHISGNGTFYHQYTKPGTYNVKVTTVDAKGNTSTATKTIVVNSN